jgi:hypothetical protein
MLLASSRWRPWLLLLISYNVQSLSLPRPICWEYWGVLTSSWPRPYKLCVGLSGIFTPMRDGAPGFLKAIRASVGREHPGLLCE